MKQTNNALKYLLAQYRAIFKNAYFKGLVSAAVLTAGLAGFAQPAAAAATLTSAKLPTDGSTITVDGKTNTNIFEEVTTSNTNLKGELVINSGSVGGSPASGNLLLGASGSNLELSGNDFSITIDAQNAYANTVGLGLGVQGNATTNNFTVDVNELNIKKGSLALEMSKTAANQSGSLIVTANNITIGTGTAITVEGNNTEDKIAAKVQLGGTNIGSGYGAPSGSGSITFGNGYDDTTNAAASVTTLNKSGIIEFLGAKDDADKVIFAGQLIGKGGELDFTSGSGTIEAYGTDVNANVTVGHDQTAVVLLTDSKETETINEGLLQFTSGTIDVQGKGTGSTGGQLVVSGGTLEISGKTLLTSYVAGDGDKVGSILVSGTM